jgi:phosphatidylglycerol:prolipoprotein diacylglycerol transferase
MLQWPNFDPVAFHLGPIAVHWYGLMYLLGFGIAWGLAMWRAKKSHGVWNADLISDLLFYCALGVIIGGRVGYMLFYDLPNLIHSPLSFFKVWQGGMSFHGGFLGVIVAMLLFCKRYQKSFFETADFIAPFVPLGLGAGRIGNFINGELWGRTTTMPWGMIYPNGGPLPRHPSELYEFLCEGIILFIVLWLFSRKPRPRMAVSSVFLIGYGLARIFCEFFREPDPQYGYLLGHWLTMGQVLSLPMVLLGSILLYTAYFRHSRAGGNP